jgi:hypothetical protein
MPQQGVTLALSAERILEVDPAARTARAARVRNLAIPRQSPSTAHTHLTLPARSPGSIGGNVAENRRRALFEIWVDGPQSAKLVVDRSR